MMDIYTGMVAGAKKDICKNLGLGFMLSSSVSTVLSPRFLGVGKYCLDNGAYSCWVNGYPFDEYTFLKCLADCRRLGIVNEFIVLPDLVGSNESFAFSMGWANRLPCKNWAICVNKFTELQQLESNIDKFSTIFVGGPDDMEWKWSEKNCKDWRRFADYHGKKLHMGACGSLDKLLFCKSIGFDSVDSTNFSRNSSFAVIEEYLKIQNIGNNKEFLFDIY